MRAATACPGGSAAAVAEAAAEAADLVVYGFTPGEPGFPGGLRGRLERVSESLYVSRTLPPDERAFVIAHELGHHVLHDDPVLEDHHEAVGAVRTLSGYSPRELKEAQADAFADEFLCPAHAAREGLTAGRTASAMARDLGIPLRVVLRQCAQALLEAPGDAVRELPTPEPPTGGPPRAAAVADAAATLVSGGPGTGKTTALRARVRHLVGEGAAPASLLVLAGSEAAAAALGRAAERSMPGIATTAFFGTARSFALDLVTKWPEAAGRTADVRILDSAAARRILTGVLAGLRACRGAAAPTPVEVAQAARLVRRIKEGCAGLEEPEAGLLAAYAAALAAEDALDAADLSRCASAALRGDAGATVRKRFRSVLVDDAQELTPAAAALVDAVAGAGTTLWVALDPDLALRRHEGADPGAAVALVRARGGRRFVLSRNLRSEGRVLAATERLAGRSGAGLPRSGTLRTPVGDTVASEGAALARRIGSLRRDGVAYGSQAVLARTHEELRAAASNLRAADIPLLDPGDMRHNVEAGWLVGIAGSVLDDEPSALRAALLSGCYRLSLLEADAVADRARDAGGVRAVLARPAAIRRLDARAHAVLARLARDVGGLEACGSAAAVLDAFLFDRRPDWVAGLLAQPGGVRARMTLVAVHHVLAAAGDLRAAGRGGVADLRARLGRLGSTDQETPFAAVDPAATGLDGVHLITIHAAQGREFDAIHVVGLSGGGPGWYGGQDDVRLLRAAVSRARSHATLSRPLRRGAGPLAAAEALRYLHDLADDVDP